MISLEYWATLFEASMCVNRISKSQSHSNLKAKSWQLVDKYVFILLFEWPKSCLCENVLFNYTSIRVRFELHFHFHLETCIHVCMYIHYRYTYMYHIYLICQLTNLSSDKIKAKIINIIAIGWNKSTLRFDFV